jgi:hypothetical protein
MENFESNKKNMYDLNKSELKEINGGGVLADFVEKVVRGFRCGCIDADLTDSNSAQYSRMW